MLSALQQGNLVHIIDKTDGIKYSVGEIINKTEPKTEYGSSPVEGMGFNVPTYFDISVKVDETIYDFKHISTNVNIVNYNNGNIVISETKEALIPIIDNILHTRKVHIENIDKYKNEVENCEDILKKLNPTFAKEKERDSRISNLEDKVENIDDKLDKILNLINNK